MSSKNNSVTEQILENIEDINIFNSSYEKNKSKYIKINSYINTINEVKEIIINKVEKII